MWVYVLRQVFDKEILQCEQTILVKSVCWKDRHIYDYKCIFKVLWADFYMGMRNKSWALARQEKQHSALVLPLTLCAHGEVVETTPFLLYTMSVLFPLFFGGWGWLQQVKATYAAGCTPNYSFLLRCGKVLVYSGTSGVSCRALLLGIHHGCCWGHSLCAFRGWFVDLMRCRLLVTFTQARPDWEAAPRSAVGWLMCAGSGLGQLVQLLFSRWCSSLQVTAVSFPYGWARRSLKWRCVLMECLVSRRCHIKINVSAQTHFLARSCGVCWFSVSHPPLKD